jgi:hypothetical protein
MVANRGKFAKGSLIFELFLKDSIKMKSKTKKNKKRKVSLIRTKELSLQLENLLKRL